MSKDTILEQKPKTRLKNANSKHYSFLSRERNSNFETGLVPLKLASHNPLSFESCLNTIKSDRFSPINTPLYHQIYIKTQPKWFTNLLEYQFDKETGEFLAKGVYQTNDFKVSNGKKIKKLDEFCKKYQPLYKQRKVTLWFLTFTRANYARLSFKQMSDIIKKYYKRQGINIRGFIWTYEISDKYHWHYHLVICTDRIDIKGGHLGSRLKFNSLWGQRTEIEFVRKDVRHYMAKYFSKCEYRLNNGLRSYGASKEFK